MSDERKQAGATEGREGNGQDAGETRAGARNRARGWGGWTGPFSEIHEMVTDVVDSALRGFSPVAGGRFPRFDLLQIPEEGYWVLMDLPGVERERLEVSTVGDELTVSGERRRPELPEGSEVLRSERWYGRFRRTLRLPPDVDTAGVRAKLEGGVLRVTLPRRREAARQRVEVEG